MIILLSSTTTNIIVSSNNQELIQRQYANQKIFYQNIVIGISNGLNINPNEKNTILQKTARLIAQITKYTLTKYGDAYILENDSILIVLGHDFVTPEALNKITEFLEKVQMKHYYPQRVVPPDPSRNSIG